MIRAGRGHLVRTLGDLAAQQGVSSQRYRKLKPYEAAGFPPRISSVRARTRLYDGEQVDAYLLGKPVPALPERDDDYDLLDRQECAAELGVSPRSWDAYKSHPLLTGHMAKVGGVEHWPRGIVHQFHNSRPGRALNRQGRTTTAAAPPRPPPRRRHRHRHPGRPDPAGPRPRPGRTARRAHRHLPPPPLTKGVALPLEGDGIRYLTTGTTPPPDALITA
ncbi:hypothetical protein ACIOGT_38605 [Streptomyces microflavus]|uniref:hypothetical protein n=1 Tax=Streptomyces microflavus TaxID=1919 RepID=UPI00380188FA